MDVMCDIKVKDRVPTKELRERLGLNDIISVLQENRMHCMDMCCKCMEYEVEGARTRVRPRRTWREVVQTDYQAHTLNREDAMDHSRWRKLIKDD